MLQRTLLPKRRWKEGTEQQDPVPTCSGLSLVEAADAGQRVQVRPNAAFNSSTMGWNLG